MRLRNPHQSFSRVANWRISRSARRISQRSVTTPISGKSRASTSSTGPPLNPPMSAPGSGKRPRSKPIRSLRSIRHLQRLASAVVTRNIAEYRPDRIHPSDGLSSRSPLGQPPTSTNCPFFGGCTGHRLEAAMMQGPMLRASSSEIRRNTMSFSRLLHSTRRRGSNGGRLPTCQLSRSPSSIRLS